MQHLAVSVVRLQISTNLSLASLYERLVVRPQKPNSQCKLLIFGSDDAEFGVGFNFLSPLTRSKMVAIYILEAIVTKLGLNLKNIA